MSTELVLNPEDLPVIAVPVDSLSLGYSPRIAGHDEQNVRILTELDRPWPPLLVHRQTYRVIDGMHRLLAARRRGDTTIEVRLYECGESEAFVLAVRANVEHGLPLSLGDRKAAARRIIGSWPEWSDRRIATTAGLSDKTVSAIRRGSRPQAGDSGDRRVGSDGRSRPVDAVSRRAAVTQLLVANPDASLRDIAGRAGVSPETVRSVRLRLRGREATGARTGGAQRGSGVDPRRGLEILVGDPALRSTEVGRMLLRLLGTFAFIDQDGSSLVEAVPDRNLPVFERLAMANAEAWRLLALLADARQAEARGREKRERVTCTDDRRARAGA
jgi:hypothetical protein